MKTNLLLIIMAMVAIATLGTAASAQADDPAGNAFRVGGFLDENGDGFNDLAPDADGDGIPNGLDPDYVPTGDGSGNAPGGDHDPENCNPEDGQGEMSRMLNGQVNSFGPGDGTGFDGTGPGDGTGFGPGDGTGVPVSSGTGQRGHK